MQLIPQSILNRPDLTFVPSVPFCPSIHHSFIYSFPIARTCPLESLPPSISRKAQMKTHHIVSDSMPRLDSSENDFLLLHRAMHVCSRARKQAVKRASIAIHITHPILYLCPVHPCMSSINQSINQPINQSIKSTNQSPNGRKATKCFLPFFLSASQTRQDRQCEVIQHNHHIITQPHEQNQAQSDQNRPKPTQTDQNHTTYRADTIINAPCIIFEQPTGKREGEGSVQKRTGRQREGTDRWIDG